MSVIALIQLSTLDYTVVIDCFPLWEKIKQKIKNLLENQNILKVVHGCGADLKNVLGSFESRCFPIIDTSITHLEVEKAISCRPGTKNQVGLKLISEFYLGLEVNKKYQKAKYSVRPLTNKMYLYSLNDARICVFAFYLIVGVCEYAAGREDAEQLKELYFKLLGGQDDSRLKGRQLKELERVFKTIFDRCCSLVESNESSGCGLMAFKLN